MFTTNRTVRVYTNKKRVCWLFVISEARNRRFNGGGNKLPVVSQAYNYWCGEYLYLFVPMR